MTSAYATKGSGITGAQYKAFLASDVFWPPGFCHDDVLLIVDDVAFGEDRELIVDEIPDNAEIIIECGDVLNDKNERIADLEDYFHRWKSQQSTDIHVLTIKAPAARLETIKDAIRAAGGEIA